MDKVQFPVKFTWGAATAAYQVEGAANEDGRGESIWDRFSHTPGHTTDGDSGDFACDHYHRYPEDIALMRQLGLKAYRFSTSWTRVLPTGHGPVNTAGLDFYDRLVDMLLAANIEPFITLHHWDLPQVLYEKGGWTNRENLYYFADFATLMVKTLGDRINKWTTFNEPGVIADNGYVLGEHAPGIKNDRRLARQVTHGLNVAHGLATQAIRAANPALQVGIVISQWGVDPASNDPADAAMAENAFLRNDTGNFNPIFKGCYHPLWVEAAGDEMPDIKPGDMALIAQKLDFLGINFYSRTVYDKNGVVKPIPGSEYTQMGWEVCAPSFRRMLNHINNEYDLPPIYITENGSAYPDVVSADGRIHDELRLDYLRQHFTQVRLAMQDGVDVRGYFVWSLMDNFEWGYGYSRRFGITYVDYATQKRIIKDSGLWYARVIATNQVD